MLRARIPTQRVRSGCRSPTARRRPRCRRIIMPPPRAGAGASAACHRRRAAQATVTGRGRADGTPPGQGGLQPERASLGLSPRGPTAAQWQGRSPGAALPSRNTTKHSNLSGAGAKEPPDRAAGVQTSLKVSDGSVCPNITSHGMHDNKAHVRSASRHTQRGTLRFVSTRCDSRVAPSSLTCSLPGAAESDHRRVGNARRPARAGGRTDHSADGPVPLASAIDHVAYGPIKNGPTGRQCPAFRARSTGACVRIHIRACGADKEARTRARHEAERRSEEQPCGTRCIHAPWYTYIWPHPSTDDGGGPPPIGSSRRDWPGRLGARTVMSGCGCGQRMPCAMEAPRYRGTQAGRTSSSAM
jgi:hypothetical protein